MAWIGTCYTWPTLDQDDCTECCQRGGFEYDEQCCALCLSSKCKQTPVWEIGLDCANYECYTNTIVVCVGPPHRGGWNAHLKIFLKNTNLAPCQLRNSWKLHAWENCKPFLRTTWQSSYWVFLKGSIRFARILLAPLQLECGLCLLQEHLLESYLVGSKLLSCSRQHDTSKTRQIVMADIVARPEFTIASFPHGGLRPPSAQMVYAGGKFDASTSTLRWLVCSRFAYYELARQTESERPSQCRRYFPPGKLTLRTQVEGEQSHALCGLVLTKKGDVQRTGTPKTCFLVLHNQL